MIRVLVTGSSGLLGSHICKRLIEQGYEVYGISKSDRNHVRGVITFTQDLRDREATEELINKIKPTHVWMLAANAAENLSTFSPIEISTSNADTFWNVLVPAINTGSLKRFVFTSSIAVYGAIHIPFREQDLPLPQDVYGVTKLSIEQSLRIMADVHKFEYVVVRPHNVYGPNQRMDDLYRNVLAIWMNQLLRGEPYTIYGDGTMKRCFSYVEDVVDIILKCGFDDVAGMTFNVGSDKSYKLNDISTFLQEIADIRIEPKYLPSRVHEVHTAIADHTLCKKVFGYKETGIGEGISKMWAYARKLGPQEYKVERPEISSEKLPSNWK